MKPNNIHQNQSTQQIKKVCNEHDNKHFKNFKYILNITPYLKKKTDNNTTIDATIPFQPTAVTLNNPSYGQTCENEETILIYKKQGWLTLFYPSL